MKRERSERKKGRKLSILGTKKLWVRGRKAPPLDPLVK